MKKMITATGKEFDCLWCGVSFTNQFFTAITNSTFDEILPVFEDPMETKTLIFDDDGQQETYTGYTTFMGFQYDERSKAITVNLISGKE